MTIPDFITRCDRHCAAAGVSRTWLSKRLFQDTTRLKDLAAGGSDIGVKRLARAVRDLEALEAGLESVSPLPRLFAGEGDHAVVEGAGAVRDVSGMNVMESASSGDMTHDPAPSTANAVPLPRPRPGEERHGGGESGDDPGAAAKAAMTLFHRRRGA